MKPKIKILFLALMSCFTNIQAQVESPPTLALGVAGVVGEKGTIDVDLLAQIISEKQGELKQEFIKKTFFNDLDDHSYVMWEFMYRSLNVLLESESKDAIKKNLLANSANLALVYGFCEFYLQLSAKMGNSNLDALLIKYDPANYKTHFFQYPAVNPNSFSASDQAEIKFLKLPDLKKYSRTIHDPIYDTKLDLNFGSVFIDLVFEVMRTDTAVVKTLGFLNVSFPLGKEFYTQHSAYHRIKMYAPAEITSALEDLRKRIEGEIHVLMGNFMLIKKISKSQSPLKKLIEEYDQQLLDLKQKYAIGNSGRVVEDIFRKLKQHSDSINSDLKGLNSAIDPTTIRAGTSGGNTAVAITQVTNDNKQLSKEISENLEAFNRFINKKVDFDQYDIYYLEKSIMPLLIRLVTEKGLDAKYLELAKEFDVLITGQLLKKLDKVLSAGGFKELQTKYPIATFTDLLELITRLDELDKVETYEYVLRIIQNAGEVYSDKKVGLYLKTMVDAINTYTILNSEDKKVDIAVEDIISRIYEKYGNRQSSIFNLYFSVGINQSISSHFTYKKLLPNSTTTETDTIKSIGFVSEKIGLKVKLIDVKWRRSFTVGETYHARFTGNGHTVRKFRSNKPLVSDVYALTYLSGLLYKVADLTTHKDFKDPIAGVGLGVAFFNSLDLNLGYNWPLQSGNDFFANISKKQIWTVGFDIKITEYLMALGKKRKAKTE
jgi:hypothetical protein